MEEGHHGTLIDYLQSLKGLGPKKFLASYKHFFLLENYLAPSSKIKLGRVETISELDVNDLFYSTESSVDESLLQARVIPLEKRDPNSSERMIFVGRSQDNDIVLPNRMVSKLHAYFCQVPGGEVMQLVDMNSTNGTFVNSARLLPSVKTNLEDEDVISFGPETNLEFLSPAAFCQFLRKLS